MPHIGPQCCCDDECDEVAAPTVNCGVVYTEEDVRYFNYFILNAERAWVGRRFCATLPATEVEVTEFLDASGNYDGTLFVDEVECENNCTYYVRAENCFGVTTCGPARCPDFDDCCTEIIPQYVFLSFPDAIATPDVPYGCCEFFEGQYFFDPDAFDPVTNPAGRQDLEGLCQYTAVRQEDLPTEEMAIDGTGSCFLLVDTTGGDGVRLIVRFFVQSSSLRVVINRSTGAIFIEWERRFVRTSATIYPAPPPPPTLPPPPPLVTFQGTLDLWGGELLGCAGGTDSNPTWIGKGDIITTAVILPENYVFGCATPGSAAEPVPPISATTPELKPRFQLVVATT